MQELDNCLQKVQNMKGSNKKSDKNWIQSAIKKPGSLKNQLGIPDDENIPKKILDKAAKKDGKIGKRARLAKTLSKLKNNK